MTNVHKLREIVESLRDAQEGYEDYMVMHYIRVLEGLIRPPDPPQAHIPGLDQTEWEGLCV